MNVGEVATQVFGKSVSKEAAEKAAKAAAEKAGKDVTNFKLSKTEKFKNMFKKVDKVDANGNEIACYSKARIGTAAGASLFTIGCMLPSTPTQG